MNNSQYVPDIPHPLSRSLTNPRQSLPNHPTYEELARLLLLQDELEQDAAPPTPPNAVYHPPFPSPSPPRHQPTANPPESSPSPGPAPTTPDPAAARAEHEQFCHNMRTWAPLLAHPPPAAFHPQTGALRRTWPAKAFPAQVRVRDSVLRRQGAMRALGPHALNVSDKYWAWLNEREAPAPVGAAERQRVRCDEVFDVEGGHFRAEEAKRCMERHDEVEEGFWMCGGCVCAQDRELSARAAWVGRYGPVVALCKQCAEEAVAALGYGVSGCVCDEGVRCLEHRIEHLEGLAGRLQEYSRTHQGLMTMEEDNVTRVAFCRCGREPVRSETAVAWFCCGCERVVVLPRTEDPFWQAGQGEVKSWFSTMMSERIWAARR